MSNGDPGSAVHNSSLAKPGEAPEAVRQPSPAQVVKLLEGPEDHAEHDHDFVDFAETFLSSEPFVERPQESQQQGNHFPGAA